MSGTTCFRGHLITHNSLNKYGVCKQCRREVSEKYRNSHKEQCKERVKASRKKKPEVHRKNTSRWRESNRDALLESYKKSSRKMREELHSAWVASKIGLPVSEIPPEVIEFKRNIITLIREIRNATSNSK